MKLSNLLLMAVLLVGTVHIASAKETDPGILPDSLLYNIELAIEKINLALTFSNDGKISKELEFAKERLSEAHLMAEKNNIEAMKKAEEEHGRLLTDVKARIKNIDGDPSSLHMYVKTEKEVEEYEQEAENESQRINLAVKTNAEGNLTEEQIRQIDDIVNNLKGQAGEVKIEVDNERTKIKIKTKNVAGKSDQEIEQEIETMEHDEGLTGEQEEHDENFTEQNEHDENLTG